MAEAPPRPAKSPIKGEHKKRRKPRRVRQTPKKGGARHRLIGAS